MVTNLGRTIIGVPLALVAAVSLVYGVVNYLAGQGRVAVRHA